MTTYIVSFEINSNNKSILESAILSLAKDYCELHDNAWLFVTEKNEETISKTLLSAVSLKDRIFFCEASRPYNCFLESKAIDYIKAKKLL